MSAQSKQSPMPTLSEFQILGKQANDGAPGALEQLRQCISQHPAIYQRLGDMSEMAIGALIAAAAGESKEIAESLRCCVEEMRRELMGDSPDRIERILVDRIIVAHLEVNHLTVQYPLATGATIKQRNAVMSLKNAAEKRLQNAVKSLLTMRSLRAQARALGNDRLRVVTPASG